MLTTRINLLPWREEAREERQKQFLILLAVIFALGIGIVAAFELFISGQISSQNGRNDYLQSHVRQLDKQVAEIADLEKRRRELLDRMQIIQDLQGTRPLIVRVFDEQVRTLPEGVFFESLSRTGNSISVGGVAESNNRVSTLMRNLDESDWFANPMLSTVSAAEKFGEQASYFKLNFSIEPPKSGKNSQDEGG